MKYLSILFFSSSLTISASAVWASEIADSSDEPDVAPSEQTEAPSAGAWLRRAFEHFRRDENPEASHAFHAAVATGNLNDAGRALAYWHIYISEQSMLHTDASAEALTGFVSVAEDILDTSISDGLEVENNSDFVQRFDLQRRLARARAFLSAAWADRHSTFGRQESSAIPIHNATEMGYFLEFAPPCAQASDRRIEPAVHVQNQELGYTEHVTITCHGDNGRVRYFFQVIGKK